MKRGVVFYAAAYAASLAVYWLALKLGFACAELLDTPGWWMRLCHDLLKSIHTWRDLTHIVAALIVSVPVGLGIARLAEPRAFLIALSSALTLCVVALLPWLILSWPSNWTAPPVLDGIALSIIAVAPALVVLLNRTLPSNNRWRGP